MANSVLVVGGIGYLGYNLALEHTSRGDKVYIVARRSSASKRERLFTELRSLAKKSILLNDLGEKTSIRSSIDAMGCPDIAYLVTGKLTGSLAEMKKAHVDIPLQWAKVLTQRCKETLIAYVSSVFSAGDPRGCANNSIVHEEEHHLRGCRQFSNYSITKAEGEKRLLELCENNGARVAILRPGLLVGQWAYHREWRLLYKLSRLHLRLSRGPYLHVTPARDVARAAMLIREKTSGCGWYYATPWRLRLGELHSLLSKELGVGSSIPIPVPASLPLPGSLARELRAQQGYRIEPYKLNKLGMKWTSIEEAVAETAEWMKRAWGRAETKPIERSYSIVIV